MSLRESISDYLVHTLKEIEEPRPHLVTREPFEVDKLAITQFPALLVNFAIESRTTESMGAPGVGRRLGSIEFDIRAFVRGTELDTQRNDLLEALEEQLERDRYLGLKAQGVMDSQVTEIEVIPRLAPLAELRIRLVVNYNYLRGSA
jgi:hypothetical protein